jgi:hypothetical protein
MSTSSPAIQDLARQLLARKPARGELLEGEADQIVRTCEKLRVPLTKFAGAAGFSSLLSRALAMAKQQAPSLAGLWVDADGSLVGFNNIQHDLAVAEATRQGEVILVSELLGLLVMFIGEPLTLNLVREAWPYASIETPTLRTEEKP